MPYMEWDSAFSLGFSELDDQHMRLFELVNRLYDLVVKGEEQKSLGVILDELVDYTVYHFDMEERIHSENGYPESGKHKEIHNQFIRKAMELQESFRDKGITISMEVLGFLSDWLKNHTTKVDMDYVKYLKNKV